MRLSLQFCVLATKYLVTQACGVLNVPGGEVAGDQVSRLLLRQFQDQSQRLVEALRRSEERAWAVIESLLEDTPSAWGRCRAFLQPADEQSLRSRLEGALKEKLRERARDQEAFRTRCSRDLASARAGILASTWGVDLAALATSLAPFAEPKAVSDRARATIRQIADDLEGAGLKHLATLVRWKPDGQTALLTFLAEYFFRREVERDEYLYRALSMDKLVDIDRKIDIVLERIARQGQVATTTTPAALVPTPKAFPFGVDHLMENSEPRLPCLLLVDVSGSMAGERAAALSHGLDVYRTELRADNLASQRVEVAVVSFGSTVELLCPFVPAEHFQPPHLKTGGKTALGAALHQALDMVEYRKKQYRKHGIGFFRPWVFLLTDGTPTDDWRPAGKRVRDGETAGSFLFHAVGVSDADFDILRELTRRPVYRLEGLRFRDLFRWLSQSQRAVSLSSPGREATVPIADPSKAGGWATLG